MTHGAATVPVAGVVPQSYAGAVSDDWSSPPFQLSLFVGQASNFTVPCDPAMVSVAPNMNSMVKIVMASLRSPGLVLGLRSTKGTAANPTRMSVGMITPAIIGWK